jgi:hypothetical protein
MDTAGMDYKCCYTIVSIYTNIKLDNNILCESNLGTFYYGICTDQGSQVQLGKMGRGQFDVHLYEQYVVITCAKSIHINQIIIFFPIDENRTQTIFIMLYLK